MSSLRGMAAAIASTNTTQPRKSAFLWRSTESARTLISGRRSRRSLAARRGRRESTAGNNWRSLGARSGRNESTAGRKVTERMKEAAMPIATKLPRSR